MWLHLRRINLLTTRSYLEVSLSKEMITNFLGWRGHRRVATKFDVYKLQIDPETGRETYQFFWGWVRFRMTSKPLWCAIFFCNISHKNSCFFRKCKELGHDICLVYKPRVLGCKLVKDTNPFADKIIGHITSVLQVNFIQIAVADPREGPGPPWFWTKIRPEGLKKIFLRPVPPPLSQGLDDRPPPPLSEGLDPPLNWYKTSKRGPFLLSLSQFVWRSSLMWRQGIICVCDSFFMFFSYNLKMVSLWTW